MTADPAFHYPPDVFEALVDAVPVLVRGKRAVLTFFEGCGVSRAYLASLVSLTTREADVSKYEIARRVLTYLNELGDSGLAARRQLIKRVAEFDNFGSCWPNDQLKAKGAVATLAELVNKKDSFTRLQQEQDRTLRDHMRAKQAEADTLAATKATRERLKAELFRLFGETNRQRRGKALEGVLNRLFEAEGIKVREAFTVSARDSDAVVEQIDGAVEIDTHLFLVEMKWWKERLGRGEVSSHLVSVYTRGNVGGILISSSGFTESAVDDCRSALNQKSVILVELKEIVMTLDRELSLLELLRSKLREAGLSKQPLTYPLRED